MRRVAGVLFALLCASGTAIADEKLRFDILFSGLKAGELEIAADVSQTRYKLVGRLESTGLVKIVRKVRYEARTNGTIRARKLVPDYAWESADTGKRFSEAEMTYRNGVPQIKTYKPKRTPRPEDVDPAGQAGSLDALTALYVALRDTERDRICKVGLRTYDGRRVAQLDMNRDSESASQVVCRGTYTRLAGYSPEELAERRVFRFTLTFTPGTNGLWRAALLDLDTLFGRVKAVRQ